MAAIPEFSGVYEDRMLPELVYLSMTLGALEATHRAMANAIPLTEPRLQAAEAEFMRLLQQNIMYIHREANKQALVRYAKPKTRKAKKGQGDG